MLIRKILAATTVALFTLTTNLVLATEMITELGAGEGQVNIVAWPGYIERGETDKKFDWVTKFEKKIGCTVKVKSANTSDEMVH